MPTKKTYSFIIIALLLMPLIIMFVYSLFIPTRECERKIEFLNQEYNGVVIKKYKDRNNHGLRTLSISTGNTELGYILVNDTSLFYEDIKVGDTVVKRKYLNFVDLHKGLTIKRYRIFFRCE